MTSKMGLVMYKSQHELIKNPLLFLSPLLYTKMPKRKFQNISPEISDIKEIQSPPHKRRKLDEDPLFGLMPQYQSEDDESIEDSDIEMEIVRTSTSEDDEKQEILESDEDSDYESDDDVIKTLQFNPTPNKPINKIQLLLNQFFSIAKGVAIRKATKSLEKSQSERLYKSTAKAYNYRKQPILTEKQLQNWAANKYYTQCTAAVWKEYRLEQYNVSSMKWLIRNAKILHRYGIDNSSVNTFLKYATICDKNGEGGWAKIPYVRSKIFTKDTKNKNNTPEPYGRYFAFQLIGIQSLNKKIRATLCHNVYFEEDICNCHPTIMVEVAKAHDCPHINLLEYRDNREHHLQELMQANNISRAEAKDIFIIAMYGGTKKLQELDVQTQFLIDLQKEYKICQSMIVKNNPVLFRQIKKSNKLKYEAQMKAWISAGKRYDKPYLRNPEVSTVSYFMQNTESSILMTMEQFYIDNGFITDENHPLIHDGSLINIKYFDKLQPLIPDLIALIKEKHGINIKLAAKQWGIEKGSPDFINHPQLQSAYDNPQIIEYKDQLTKLNSKRNAYRKIAPYYYPVQDEQIEADIKLTETKLPALDQYYDNNDTIIIKSSMGSCKTVNTYDWFRNLDPKVRVLIVSFRRTLERKYERDLEDLNFVNYETCPNKNGRFDAHQYPRFIVQINSLWKVSGGYDVVVLDEISYTIDTLINFADHKTQNVNALESFIQYSQKLICLDAYISQWDVDYIKNLRKNKRTKVILNEVTEQRGTIYNLRKDIFKKKIMDKLKRKKKVVLISNSKSFLLDQMEPLFKENKIKYKIIYKDDNDIKDINDWADYDVVAYTPTIVAGLSFEIPDVFDCRFAYFCNKSAGADICTQMLFRVRQTILNVIYTCINWLGTCAYPLSTEGIEEWIHQYINLDRKDKYFIKLDKVFNSGLLSFNNFTRKYAKTPYYWMLVNSLRKRFQSVTCFGGRLNGYLKVQGWIAKQYKIDMDEAIVSAEEEKINRQISFDYATLKAKATYKEYKKHFNNIPTDSEFEEIMSKQRKSNIQKMRCNLYTLVNHFEIDLKETKMPIFMKLLENFGAYKFEHGFKETDHDDPVDWCLDEIAQIPFGDDKLWLKQRKRDFFMKAKNRLNCLYLLGFEDWYDTDTILTDDQLLSKAAGIEQYIMENWEEFHTLSILGKKKEDYKLSTMKKQSFVQVMNGMLKHIGRILQKERVGVNKIAQYTLHSLV